MRFTGSDVDIVAFHELVFRGTEPWIPACAGMTMLRRENKRGDDREGRVDNMRVISFLLSFAILRLLVYSHPTHYESELKA